jgi:hypothetical protein
MFFMAFPYRNDCFVMAAEFGVSLRFGFWPERPRASKIKCVRRLQNIGGGFFECDANGNGGGGLCDELTIRLQRAPVSDIYDSVGFYYYVD